MEAELTGADSNVIGGVTDGVVTTEPGTHGDTPPGEPVAVLALLAVRVLDTIWE